MKHAYPATVSPEADGRLSIWFEDLPGCATSGENIADAIESARDALGGWLDSAERHGDEIPAPSDISTISLSNNNYATWIDIDLAAYRRSLSKTSVKKTLTIPGWLNDLAEQADVNFSQTLQTALKDQLGVE